jgi:hypothetical protein
MIEINLSTQGKNKDLTKIGGINLSLLNIKYIVIGLIMIYTIEPVIDIFYGADIKNMEIQTKEIKKKQRKLSVELRKYDSVKQQVKDLDEQQTKLKAKINIVKKIVDIRKNPFNVLKYIAENTPSNVWLKEIEISDNKLKLVGYSVSWKSIGDFINNLKTSIFFNGNVGYIKPSGMDEEFNKQSVEPFVISTEIVGF